MFRPDLLKTGPNGEKTVAAVPKIAHMGANFFLFATQLQQLRQLIKKEHIRQQLINIFQKMHQK
jgi:hypothetical protein